ncbi:MAG TPA: 23S rRNA (uracil(1939)-C(5))-methyltransferase RlmD [Steroidobacteraceae bacterium]|nr:23S rRNA (uracil(1939)-C(5))-methyltransferase RlmD [Steroidobacteraceae bacterium]
MAADLRLMRQAVRSNPEPATVIDLAHDGRGVARIDGKTVFVHDALPGEQVTLVRRSRQRRYDEAVLVDVAEPSPDRVAPGCPHFGNCGGCVLQHLDPARQLAHKERQLLENLARIGHVEPESVLAPLASPGWGYRRRARLGVKWVAAKDRVLVGFRERGSSYLADIERCRVLTPPLDELILPLARTIARLTVRARLPQVEVAAADNATALVLRVLDPLTNEDLAVLREFAVDHGVRLYLQPGGYDTVTPLEPPADDLYYALPEFDVRLGFEPADFIQVNGALNRRMVAQALDLLAPDPADAVLDLFCGLGNFSLPLARRAESVLGLEGDAGLVARARANAARNGLANASFAVANLFEDNQSVPWANRRYDKVLIDPPRAGALAMLPLLSRFSASRVVYISCHPGSLARDAGLLVQEHGWRLVAAGVMDMFPHTAHVESIAVFEPR